MTVQDDKEMDEVCGPIRYHRSAFYKQTGLGYATTLLFPGPREKYLLTRRIEDASKEGRVVVDSYIPYDGGYTIVPCTLVRPDGIWVFEIDGREGVLTSTPGDPVWTHTAAENGREYRFCSPFVANRGHVDAVASLFGLDESMVHGIVVYSDDTDFTQVGGRTAPIVHLSEVTELLRSELGGGPALDEGRQGQIYSALLEYADRDETFKALHADCVKARICLAENE